MAPLILDLTMIIANEGVLGVSRYKLSGLGSLDGGPGPAYVACVTVFKRSAFAGGGGGGRKTLFHQLPYPLLAALAMTPRSLLGSERSPC